MGCLRQPAWSGSRRQRAGTNPGDSVLQADAFAPGSGPGRFKAKPWPMRGLRPNRARHPRSSAWICGGHSFSPGLGFPEGKWILDALNALSLLNSGGICVQSNVAVFRVPCDQGNKSYADMPIISPYFYRPASFPAYLLCGVRVVRQSNQFPSKNRCHRARL